MADRNRSSARCASGGRAFQLLDQSACRHEAGEIGFGVEVVRHDADYTSAVERARAEADGDASIYFVDDERSRLLFLGYSAAAVELRDQLAALDVPVDAENPLFLYLPCGIGGAPGGVAFGAKAAFGDHAHGFFVEPVQSPCALVQLMSEDDRSVSVYDFGLTNRTEADGMAVARVSAFVAEVMRPMLSGAFTVADEDLLRWLRLAWQTQGLRLEPSAAASFAGPGLIVRTDEGRAYLDRWTGGPRPIKATHVLWTTGGTFVPEAPFADFLARAEEIDPTTR